LFAIAGRPDGAELLMGRVDGIGHDLLSSPFEHIQGGEVIILGRLTPTPPGVVHFLLTFVKQADRDPNARGGAIFELLRIAPEDPELVATIREFLSGPIDSNVRIGVLNALGNPRTKDFQLIALVTESLRDPNPGVRLTAIRALMRNGKEALQQAETELSRLAADPGQPAEVQENAKQALQRLHTAKK
jgi:HEAT repeat protein